MAAEKRRLVEYKPTAREDLSRIWEAGLHLWSLERTEAYVADLYEAIDLLAENPAIVRERSEFDPPVRVYTFRSHVIIFRETDDHLDVLRIRHGREDWAGDLTG